MVHECRLLGGCKIGRAKITKGYQLPAKHIIHTVGPVWRGGNHGEPELLASCYKNSLLLAEKHQVQSIAFPSISTGIFGYPIDLAAQTAINAVQDFFSQSDALSDVMFCCFTADDLHIFCELLSADKK